MIYISWAAFYEGASDRAYYDILLPRVMEEVTLADGVQQVTVAPTPVFSPGRTDRTVASVAKEVCANKQAIHLFFVHADAGGRHVEQSLDRRASAYCKAVEDQCAWNPARCILIMPRHATEAWVLADAAAILRALGITGSPATLDLPRDGVVAEALGDPKAKLAEVIRRVPSPRRRQHGAQLFSAVAQEQRLSTLRTSKSFQMFEQQLRGALTSLGCLPQPGLQ